MKNITYKQKMINENLLVIGGVLFDLNLKKLEFWLIWESF